MAISCDKDSALKPFLWSAVSGLLMSFAWWVPGSSLSVLLGWGAAVALVGATLHSKASYRSLYLAGLIQNCLGFYWLHDTIRLFGGFPWYAAGAVFALYVIVSACQNLVYLFVYRRLPPILDRVWVRIALAWVFSEWVSVRIFPWYFGHTQLGFPELAQAADLAGAPILSLFMLWVSESVFQQIRGAHNINLTRVQRLVRSAPALLLFCLILGYGARRLAYFDSPLGPSLKVGVVQANISIEEKHNMRLIGENKAQYVRLTSSLPKDSALVIWPESVVQDMVPADIGSARLDRRIPYFEGKHLLTGALTFHSEQEYYNSALQVLSDGSVPSPYHKQILMPFGEYMPGGSLFPWLKELNPAMGQFTAGTEVAVKEFPTIFSDADPSGTGLPSFKAAPLICYEDVVPSLSREAVEKGAEVLINLTNDAWFGDTIAPYQHHLIASFRAIETRRFLIRSTNSGLTAIVDPTGATVSSLPPFSEGAIWTSITLLNEKAPYTMGVGDSPWWVLSALCLLTLVIRATRRL